MNQKAHVGTFRPNVRFLIRVACVTAQAAIAAGSGWLDVNVMLRYGILIGLVEVVVLVFVGYPILATIM